MAENNKSNTGGSKTGKIISIAISVIILAAAGFALFRLGHNDKNKSESSQKNIGNAAVNQNNNDRDFYPDGSADVVFIAENASPEELSEAVEVMLKRLDSRNLENISAEADEASMSIKAHYEWQFKTADYNPEKTAISLCSENSIKFILGDEVDENSNPTGELAADGCCVALAEIIGQTSDNKKYNIRIILDDEGSASLLKASENIAGSDIPLTLWTNNRIYSLCSVSEPITDGIIDASVKFSSQAEAEEFVCSLTDGTLGIELSIDTFQETT
ncbi:MAG: hypothetical protein ACI4JE_06155 [Ruminococcus sp.]